VVLLALYWPTAYSIYAIWRRSDTFAHGFLIVPAVLWLLWRDRSRLRLIPVRPSFSILAAVAVAGFVWMAARLAAVSVASQFAFLLMLEFSVVTMLGLRMSRQMAFPLLFLLFAVPFGEFMMPWLIDRTSDATVALLKLSAVPVYREGNHLQLPSGPWSVVEACSGLRYLIASLVAGTLYAYLRYSSVMRRLVFIAAAIAVPLIANWLRAYGIVMLAHLTDNKLGTNIDHFIYGWVFFGIVMASLFYVGSLWQESAVGDSSHSDQLPSIAERTTRGPAVLVPAGLLCVAVAIVWPAILGFLKAPVHAAPARLAGLMPANGWTVNADEITSWRPRFGKASSMLSQQFTKEGRVVGLYVAYYRNQSEESKLVSTENVLVRNDDPIWKVTSRRDVHQAPDSLQVRDVRAAGRNQQLAIRQWYWVDGHYTGSPYLASMQILMAQLRKHGDDGAAIIIYTPMQEEQDVSSAKVLDAFASDMAGPLAELLTQAQSQ